MPIRPSNISHSHSSKGGVNAQTSNPYLLSDDGSCSDYSDFSFEVEEEIVQISKQKNSLATIKKTNSVRSSYNSTQPKSSHPDASRKNQRGLKSKAEQKSVVGYKPGSVRKSGDDSSIMSDDDFSISVASETDGLMSSAKSLSSKAKKRVVDVKKQPSGSRRSIEQSRLDDRRGNKRDDASTTSSKTAIQSLMEKLSSMGDTSESKSIPSQSSIVTAKQKTSQRKELFSVSPSVQSLKSKAAGSIDYAESIVKSQGDIEYGASTTTGSTSSSSGKRGIRLWSTGKGTTVEGVKVTTPNSKRSSKRKICCIVGFLFVAAGGTVGALIGLDVILKEKITPSSEPPEIAPETTLTSSYNDSPWYVDWDAFQCVMDCNGRPPCGGRKKEDDERYSSLRECCSEGMGDFIDENWTVEFCMEITAVEVETEIPTYSPTPEKKKETGFPTTGPQELTSFPTKPAEIMYFADFSNMKCSAESTSRKARWERGYETMSDCCEDNFWGDGRKECMGEDIISTQSVAMYYPDYGGRNCVEVDARTKQSWDIGYETKNECCEVHFSWDRSSICFGGEEEGIDTATPTSDILSPRPTPKPTSSSIKVTTSSPVNVPTTFSPTLRPTTLHPTLAPSNPPTRTPSRSPTSSPVIPGSPTRSPIVSPTLSPSNSPTYLPTAFPSISVPPTFRPSFNPSQTPTGPTPSPTGELETLRAMLVKASPISSENLFLEDSAQYRAMVWLVENTLYVSYPDDRKIQRWALSTFYYSLYGDNWSVTDGWVTHKGDLENECTWHGISCTESGTVLSIDLKANRVYGRVPDEISLFVDLEYLSLSENQVRSIPASLINLPKLKVLDLHKNRLQEIPGGDYGSSILEELYLSYNGISTIPDGFFQLRSVKILWLANNRISSTLSGFGKMTLLEELDLESNEFNGPIPEEMFSLVNLKVLYLYDNELAGQFPPGLSQMTSLTELDLHSNHIGGELPTEIGSFSSLSELYLGNNNIVGQIPSQLYNVASLTVIDISENYLNSTIGSELGNLNQLTELDLHDNYKKNDDGQVDSFGIHGSIPDTIGSLSLLTELRLDNNYVEGTLPPTIGDLQSLEILRLESNNFHGSIKAVANAKNLQYLHLWSNYFSGTISNSIGELSQIVEIFLDDNEFSGWIPSEMGLLSNAKYMSLGLNDLEGVIPDSFGSLSSLERLDLQGNNLSGEVPKEIGNILTLQRIRLEGNQFSGDIPNKVCTLDSLKFLSGNCEVAADTEVTDATVAVDTAIENSWTCNCCTVCDD